MLWKTIPPDSSTNLEPIELQNLKYQLANVTCTCLSCNRSKELCTTNPIFYQQHKEVQAEDRSESSGRFTQVMPHSMIVQNNNMSKPHQDVLCPSCVVTMNLLQGRVMLVLKDEECETNARQFCCDKSTGKMIKSLEKTTSITSKPLQMYSELSLCDFFSDWSSETESRPDKKPKSHDKVRFQDYHEDLVPEERTFKIDAECVCLESFINTIRPPLE